LKTLPQSCINLIIETICKHKSKLHETNSGTINFSIVNNILTVSMEYNSEKYFSTFENLLKIMPLNNELDTWFKLIIKE
jgi:hypothetical protein